MPVNTTSSPGGTSTRTRAQEIADNVFANKIHHFQDASIFLQNLAPDLPGEATGLSSAAFFEMSMSRLQESFCETSSENLKAVHKSWKSSRDTKEIVQELENTVKDSCGLVGSSSRSANYSSLMLARVNCVGRWTQPTTVTLCPRRIESESIVGQM